jgi:hypothetical protein
MDEIKTFVDECRADPWFQSHPEVVDRLEIVLTNFYLADEGPEWQASGIKFAPSSNGPPIHLSTGVRHSLRCSRPSE